MAVATFAAARPGLAATIRARAEALVPIERQVREQFPSLALDSQATLEPAQELVAGQMESGMRALSLPSDGVASSADELRVFYPASYNGAFVVESGGQRVVLRAVGTHFAQAEAASGKIFYTSPHDSIDVIEVPSPARSEELMLLHNARAPRVFDYEIVEMRGVAGLSLQDGAIRFVPDRVPVPTASEMAKGRLTAPRPSLQIERPWVVDSNGKRSESMARWTILKKKDGPQMIRLTINADPLSYPLVVDPSFFSDGWMTAARRAHTATLLSNGKVLITGGQTSTTGYLNTAELFDPSNSTFTATSGNMTTSRWGHTATALLNGKVLIAGGQSGGGGYLNTAELYDPFTRTFAATSGNMTSVRWDHTATLLPGGKVLITGGSSGSGPLNTAEVYDPDNETFTATAAPMTSARSQQTATLLPNGKVLIAGGHASGLSYSNTADLYDPASRTFTATSATMNSARARHTATLLSSGKVLIAGGTIITATWNTAELYDPLAGTFTATSAPMTSARFDHTATLLPNGSVLLAGGFNGSAYLSTADVYDPTSGTFSSSPMTSARSQHTATLLPDGFVLVAGGYDGSTYLNAVELCDPSIGVGPAEEGTFTASSVPMFNSRASHAATLLADGTVLLTGGLSSGGGYSNSNEAELFFPDTGIFSNTNTPMTAGRAQHTATLLPSGKVLIAGGFNGSATLSSAEVYDPAGRTFTATSGTMTAARLGHTATLLRSGKVLITGGEIFGSGATYLSSAELYDPATRTFTATSGTMTAARAFHTATLLPNGQVLIAGGQTPGLVLRSAELYDPATGTFTPTSAPMAQARELHTATLLPDGTVLIVGGLSDSLPLRSAELYDSGSGTFTNTSTNMLWLRYLHTATLLSSGEVLIAGGEDGSGNDLNSAEVYLPFVREFISAANAMTTARYSHTATLLLSGKVLIAGGYDASGTVNTAELYDANMGFSDTRRPVVSSLTNPLCQPASLALGGSLFIGDSEGSSGSANSSAGNTPVLRLRRVDDDQLDFRLAQNFSASSFFSATLSNLSSGRYRAAIVSNAIPSNEQIIDVETTPLLGSYGNVSVGLSGSTIVTPSSLPAGYDGALYPQTATGSGGFTGSLTISEAGVVTVADAGPVGDFTITVSSSTSCGSPSTTFTLSVLGPPSSLAATGGAPQSAQVNTSFATPLQAEVTDSAGHPLSGVGVTFTDPSSGATAALPNGGAALTNSSGVASIIPTANGILGSYNVTAVVGALTAQFALTNTPATPTNVVATAATTTSVSVTWNGTSGATYEVVRVGAGSTSTTIGTSTSGSLTDTNAAAGTAYLYEVHAIAPAASPFGIPDLATTVLFTDPTLVPRTTPVKTVHFTELRTAVDAVRTLAGLGAGTYTDPTLTPGVTRVRAVHVTDLRTALDAARSALLLPAIIYTRPTIPAGSTTISASDINDLRAGVR